MADQSALMSSLGPALTPPAMAAATSKPAIGPVRPAKTALPSKASGPVDQPPVATGSPQESVDQLNGHLQQTASRLRVLVDQSTGRTTYAVVNQATGEVVLQMPSAEMLAMARRVRELEKQMGATGALVDKEG